MLVLSRMKDECVMVGRYVRIRVVDIRGDKVRLGIQAPDAVEVHREEVLLRILAGETKQDAIDNAKPRDGENTEKQA